MIIHKIRMINFRGFHDKTIDFKNKIVVLFSAANGIGKTTTVDAIEWCLTGDIGRLKTAFDTRSTNDTDRRMNTNGILKNRDAAAEDQVRVDLWLFDGEKEFILSRKQTRDELNPILSAVAIDEKKELAEAFLHEYVDDSFYNFHFCDVQKSFNVQSKKRKDLKELFSEFITNYDAQKQIAENLDIFAEDVERYIADEEKQKIPQDIIRSDEERLEKVYEVVGEVVYPDVVFYLGEKTEIESLNKEALVAQKSKIVNCGYNVAKEILDKLVKNEGLKTQLHVIKEIASYWETKGEFIRLAMENGLFKETNTIVTLEENLKKLENLSLSRDTIFQDGKSVIALKNDDFTQSDFEIDKNTIKEYETRMKTLSSEIELLSKNNKMLKLLSVLSANKQVIMEYRDTTFQLQGVVRCPICGSESFASIEKDSILREADDYIRQNGEVVKEKEAEKTLLKSEHDALYRKIINCARKVVEQEKEKIKNRINALKMQEDEVKPYIYAIKSLQNIRTDIDVERLNEEKIAELIESVEEQLLDEVQEQKERENYQQILNLLGYKYEDETVKQTCARVSALATDVYEVSNFSYDLFVSKINAISKVLANQDLNYLNQKIKSAKDKNQKIDEEIKQFQKLKEFAFERANSIRDVIDELSKDEYEKVGPVLEKFYNKLARFNSGDGIHILQEKDGISLVDNKGKNIVNVLSNGQISIFILAYFFAGINVRNDYEKMKTYFIDDLTSCMDDVNMLAFMDLIKYQMSSKSTIEQLFFITCDERISKLFKYKLNGQGIEICELLEKDFS